MVRLCGERRRRGRRRGQRDWRIRGVRRSSASLWRVRRRRRHGLLVHHGPSVDKLLSRELMHVLDLLDLLGWRLGNLLEHLLRRALVDMMRDRMGHGLDVLREVTRRWAKHLKRRLGMRRKRAGNRTRSRERDGSVWLGHVNRQHLDGVPEQRDKLAVNVVLSTLNDEAGWRSVQRDGELVI